MPRDIDGLIDDIDRLVDEQLASGPVDDYNTNRYDRCPHCSRDWHGIVITERVERMRWSGRFDDDYRVADDDSRVICPGSEFIGPLQAQAGYVGRFSYVEWFTPAEIAVLPPEFQFPRRGPNFSFSVDAATAVAWNWDTPENQQAPGDPRSPHYVTVDDETGRRSGFTVDRFILDEWQSVGRISGDGPRIRYWDRNFNLIATEGEPTPAAHEPSQERPTPIASDDRAVSTRRRERQRLRARTRQQAQAANDRQALLARMRERTQEMAQ